MKLASVATGIDGDIVILDLVHGDFFIEFGDSVSEPNTDKFIYHNLGSVRLGVG